MKIRFWGVRGSIPAPGPSTVKYGGNTACIEIRSNNNDILILDAGSGLRELGNFLIANDFPKGPLKVNILLSHTHWDHIQGFPFFGPAFIPTSEITFHGPVSFSKRLDDIVAGQMNYNYFPVKLDELKATIKFNELQETTFDLGPFHIRTKYLNHPILCLGYRIDCGGKSFCSIYDNEPYYNVFRDDAKQDDEEIDQSAIEEADKYVTDMNEKVVQFMEGADLVVYDSQYRKEEYSNKKGWGHSTVDHAVESAIKAKVKHLALFHHDPLRTDNQLDEMERYAKTLVAKSGKKMITFFARERLEVEL